MTFVETREKLANHSDFKLFKNIIFKHSELSNRDLYPSGGVYSNGELDHTDNEYHVRIGSWSIVWNDKMINQLKNRFDELNSKTKELKFQFTNTCDFDEEIGERTWDARIYFKVVI